MMLQSEPHTDRVMICRSCGKTFIFSAAGQEFFIRQGFREAPRHCRACRAKRNEKRAEKVRTEGAPTRYSAVCWSCQRTVEVPFKPAPQRPVYCRICHGARKRQGLV
jgi:CxxC-x17-CxxC domain-containing protein